MPPLLRGGLLRHANPNRQYLPNGQRELRTDGVDVGYIGSQKRNLYGFRTSPSAQARKCSIRGVVANFGVLSYVNDTFKASYNAASVKLTRRFSQGISLTTNYTFAKSIDNASGTRTQGLDTLFPQDSSCLDCERGLSSFDVRHRWVLGSV